MSGSKGTHQIKDGARPAGSGHYGDLNHIRWLVENTDPAAVAAAGAAWLSTAAKLAELHENIRGAAAALAKVYGGESGAAAQQALRRVHATAVEVSHRSKQMGDALHWYGEDILPWYKENIPGTGLIHSDKDDKYATEYMQRLNERIAQTHDAMPSQVSKDLPGVGRGDPFGQTTSSGASGSIIGSPDATNGGGSSSSGRNVGDGHGSVGSHHDRASSIPGGAQQNVSDGGTDLAGLSGSGGVTGGLGGPGGGLGGPGGVGGLPGSVPGSGTPSGVAGPAVLGPGVASGSRPGGRGAAGRGGTGGPMVPGTGQGQGEQEQERTRDFWLAEDPEIWGAEQGVPSVIGAPPVPTEPDIGEVADQDEILDTLLEDEGDPNDDSGTSKKRAEPEQLDAPPELRGPDWLT
jgi:hypothetical protein